jgi:hypothetical protein
MGIASPALAVLIILMSTFILIFPTYQTIFAQVEEGADQPFVPVVGVILGGVIGTTSSLIGILLTNRHNMKVKKEELKHSLSIELLKHRIDCYALASKYIKPATYFSSNTTYGIVQELYGKLSRWEEQEKGGLIMSHDSRNSYISILDAILKTRHSTGEKANIDPKNLDRLSHVNISQENAKRITQAVSNFRTALLRDIRVEERK